MHPPRFLEQYNKRVNLTQCKFASINWTPTRPPPRIPSHRILTCTSIWHPCCNHRDTPPRRWCRPLVALLLGSQPWFHISITWGCFQNYWHLDLTPGYSDFLGLWFEQWNVEKAWQVILMCNPAWGLLFENLPRVLLPVIPKRQLLKLCTHLYIQKLISNIFHQFQ